LSLQKIWTKPLKSFW